MTISVLTQASITNLAMLANEDKNILKKSFDQLKEDHDLQIIDIDLEFNRSIELILPEGKRQEENFDEKNAMLLADALPNLTDVDATDRRLWVTLGLREYREYANKRWAENGDISSENWIISGGAMRGHTRHAISRLWWFYRLCSRIEERSTEENLKLLLFNSDYRSSLIERHSSSSISSVVSVILEITEEYTKKGIVFERSKFRLFMQKINEYAGRSHLSVLNKAQLKERLTPLYLEAYCAD